MTIQEDYGIEAGMVKVEAGGAVVASHRLSLSGRIENDGAISAQWLWLHGLNNLLNAGSIEGGVVILAKDSLFNTGSIAAEDSLVVGYYRRFFNSGSIDAGFLYDLGYLFNAGELRVDSAISRFFQNTGLFRVNGALFVGGWFINEGELEAGAIAVVSGFENSGVTRCFGAFENGMWAAADSYILEGGELYTVDFVNSEDCTLSGPGTLCISGHSENHGAIAGPINICDITLAADATPPYLDVNTGGFLQPIYRCAAGTCATVDIADPGGIAALSCSPVPAHEEAVLRFPGMAGSVMLRDAQGRMAAWWNGPFHGEARIPRSGLPDGWYAAHVLGADGGPIGTVRLLFARP